MKLTAKREQFAQGIAGGMTQIPAYRAAYNADKMSDNAVHVEASRLMKHGKVAARVKEFTDVKQASWAENHAIPVSPDVFDALVGHLGSPENAKEWASRVLAKEAETLGMSIAMAMTRGSINSATRYAVLDRAGFKCQACGAKPEPDNDVKLHIDHIMPFSLGGTNDPGNLQVLCLDCNYSKGNRYSVDHNG